MGTRELGNTRNTKVGASRGRVVDRGFTQGRRGARPAGPGGIPYVAKQCHSRVADTGNRCKARPVKGTEHCVGHTRSADAN